MSVSKLQTFIHDTLSTYSLGAYRALVSGFRSASQVLVDPDWLGAPVRARTVESPILDIVPKVGTPMAVVCQDAAPSFPLAVGQIKEEGASEAMTAWVRADLNDAPDDIAVGGDGTTILGTDSTGASASGVATFDSTTAALSGPKAAVDDAIDVLLAVTPPTTPILQSALVPLLTALKIYLAAEQSAAAFSSSVTAST